MLVYRIHKRAHGDDVSGQGAEKYGGRLNNKGTRALYSSESRALAMLEYLAHVPIDAVPHDLVMLTIELPKNATIRTIALSELPHDWQSFPLPTSTQKFGDELLHSNSHLAFALPSTLIPFEFNYLINPNHPQIHEVKVLGSALVTFDRRLK